MAANKRTDEAFDMFDVDKAKVCDLRRYLKDHGLPVSGSKSELQSRVKNAREMGRKPLAEIQVEDEICAEARRLERMITPLGEDLPDPMLLKSGWTKDVHEIPSVTKNDLYNYLVLNNRRTFDGKASQAQRQLKSSKVFYHDRHVHAVQYHEIDRTNSHCFVKAKVIPSLTNEKSTKKPDRDTWICIAKMSGQVHAAGCSCEAGEGESCNHVAALLYAVVDITDKKKDGLDAATSQECLWNKPRARKLSPKKTSELVFKKQKFLEHEPKFIKDTKDVTDCKLPPVTPFNMDNFKEKLKICNPHAALLLGFQDTASQRAQKQSECTEIFNLHKVPYMYHDRIDINSEICRTEFRNYFSSLSCTKDQCQFIEKNTRGQHKNKNWEISRYGRITSSNFGLVCKRKEETKPDSLVKTILNYTEFEVPAVKWGRTHEPAARRFYVREMRKEHINLTVKESGLVINEKYPQFGASPDGIVHCEHCTSDGLLEIKCPYKYRNETPAMAAENTDFFCKLENGKVKLKKNHKYHYQIQGQMAITG